MQPKDWIVGTTTASANTPNTVLKVEDIKKAIELINALPPEPFKQWMEEAGKSPDDGYELYLPAHVKQLFPNVPDYVKFSQAIHKPIIVLSTSLRDFKYD